MAFLMNLHVVSGVPFSREPHGLIFAHVYVYICLFVRVCLRSHVGMYSLPQRPSVCWAKCFAIFCPTIWALYESFHKQTFMLKFTCELSLKTMGCLMNVLLPK